MRFRSAIALLFAASAVSSFGDDRVEKLTRAHREWLEEEVVYIIADQERDVFLSLETVEERDRFIEAFWERRDPDPAKPGNEFKDEHYARLEHANKTFSRDAPKPGWKTDRGRFWIILGEPHEIQRYDGLNEVVANELWIYNGDTKLGVPPRFNLLFYRDQDIGDYELYHPLGDGPEALLRGGAQPYFRVNQNQAIDVLEIVSMDLARASLTVDLTEPVGDFLSARNSRQPMTSFVRPPMNVENVIANIEESARKRIDTDYLEGYLRFKDKVSADYSFRFVPSRQYFTVLIGPESTPFVHYSIELQPKDFSLQADEGERKFYTTLEVTVEIRDPNGNLVAISENSPYLELTGSQMLAVAGSPFAYHDDFPLLPGRYKLSLVVRNRATKQFTAAEREMEIVPPPAGPGLGALVLGYKTELTQGPAAHRAFQVGGEIVYPAIDGTFTAADTLHAFVQTLNAAADSHLRFSIWRETERLQERVVPIAAHEGGAVLEAFPLTGLESGSYRMRAELLDPSSQVIAETDAALSLSPRTSIPRPDFVFRHSFNTDSPGLLALAQGQQYMAAGNFAGAEGAFARAVAANNPNLVVARWKLATVLLYTRKADQALELLLPLADRFGNEPEVVEGLGLAYYLKSDYAQALPHLERSLTLRAPDAPLLNALGDSYQKLGRLTEARAVFERSLALNPQQAAVKERIEALSKSQ
jgi:GWxTD domain-containing protein